VELSSLTGFVEPLKVIIVGISSYICCFFLIEFDFPFKELKNLKARIRVMWYYNNDELWHASIFGVK